MWTILLESPSQQLISLLLGDCSVFCLFPLDSEFILSLSCSVPHWLLIIHLCWEHAWHTILRVCWSEVYSARAQQESLTDTFVHLECFFSEKLRSEDFFVCTEYYHSMLDRVLSIPAARCLPVYPEIDEHLSLSCWTCLVHITFTPTSFRCSVNSGHEQRLLYL